jgi:hypothetical protein
MNIRILLAGIVISGTVACSSQRAVSSGELSSPTTTTGTPQNTNAVKSTPSADEKKTTNQVEAAKPRSAVR